PMHALLGLQIPVRVGPRDGERRALEPRALARLILEQLLLVAAPLAEAQVHPQQHLGPVLRLEPARAGMDLDDGVAPVVLAAEELLELELVERRGHGGDLLTELAERVGIAFLGELEEDLRLVDALPLAPPAVDGMCEPGGFAVHALGALRIVPEVGRRRLR